MTTPTVTELPRRLEPVSRDTFAEDEPIDGRVECHRGKQRDERPDQHPLCDKHELHERSDREHDPRTMRTVRGRTVRTCCGGISIT